MLKFLDELEEDLIKKIIAVHLDYLTISSMIMANKLTDKLNAEQVKLKEREEQMRITLRQLRGLREDIAKGEFIV